MKEESVDRPVEIEDIKLEKVSGGAADGQVSGDAICQRAQSVLGMPYIWDGVGPEGYDCCGLVSYCVSGLHTLIGTTATFLGWERVGVPKPGDICVNSGHCGIFIGGSQMIHAPAPGAVVSIGSVQSGMIFVKPPQAGGSRT